MKRDFQVTSKRVIYTNPWLTLEEYEIIRDGQPGVYSVVGRIDGSIIIASTADDRTLFVKQYRFPVEGYAWELPMGGIEAGENPAEAAARELLEETGLKASVTRIGSFLPMPGLTPQRTTVFTADISDDALPGLESFDDPVDEIVERKLLSQAEIKTMIAAGEISDAFTLSALALLDRS